MKRNLVISDIHGAFKALEQVLERCEFDPEFDTLIVLGDVADGFPEIRECFEYLMDLDNLVYCKGNHDEWLYKHLTDTFVDIYERQLWLEQGGYATLKSIGEHDTQNICDFIENAKLYHTIDDKLFCHAGVPLETRKVELDGVDPDFYIWDRSMVEAARYASLGADPVVPNFSEVFCGHTPTICYGYTNPKNYSNVWLCDTGASYDGKLTIMDVNTKEFWQSDPVPTLYPNHKGR